MQTPALHHNKNSHPRPSGLPQRKKSGETRGPGNFHEHHHHRTPRFPLPPFPSSPMSLPSLVTPSHPPMAPSNFPRCRALRHLIVFGLPSAVRSPALLPLPCATYLAPLNEQSKTRKKHHETRFFCPTRANGDAGTRTSGPAVSTSSAGCRLVVSRWVRCDVMATGTDSVRCSFPIAECIDPYANRKTKLGEESPALRTYCCWIELHTCTHTHTHTSLGIPGPGLRSRPPSVGCAMMIRGFQLLCSNKLVAPFVSLVGPPPSIALIAVDFNRSHHVPYPCALQQQEGSNQRCRDQISVLIPVLSLGPRRRQRLGSSWTVRK
ncbi:hypothetical protein B0T18DRAFT_13998 [Schizothecium vesticola]|uniref:Uncharacterized protein n=1 Tax=Schizothecium vesticola TaxID=314040 RepID=A0AA40F980_9PEZI|nr:hypothetical protein B0T18DRAFT_13998 [Schizothecium vesticola]